MAIGLLGLAFALTFADVPPPAEWERLRVQSQQLREAAERAFTSSHTFREIVAKVERSGLIVYVSAAACAKRVRGCTLLVAASSGSCRFLRVNVDTFQLSYWDIPAILAHELQHALEIGDSADVVDDESLRALFARIGRRSPTGFETEAARRIERQVLDEMR